MEKKGKKITPPHSGNARKKTFFFREVFPKSTDNLKPLEQKTIIRFRAIHHLHIVDAYGKYTKEIFMSPGLIVPRLVPIGADSALHCVHPILRMDGWSGLQEGFDCRKNHKHQPIFRGF